MTIWKLGSEHLTFQDEFEKPDMDVLDLRTGGKDVKKALSGEFKVGVIWHAIHEYKNGGRVGPKAREVFENLWGMPIKSNRSKNTSSPKPLDVNVAPFDPNAPSFNPDALAFDPYAFNYNTNTYNGQEEMGQYAQYGNTQSYGYSQEYHPQNYSQQHGHRHNHHGGHGHYSQPHEHTQNERGYARSHHYAPPSGEYDQYMDDDSDDYENEILRQIEEMNDHVDDYVYPCEECGSIPTIEGVGLCKSCCYKKERK